MTHTALQRVLVRMLYDPEFQEAVYQDPELALAGLSLDAAERAWLLAADPRSMRTDPLRRARGLRALLEEYPASAALAAGAVGGVQGLDRFFSSPQLHAAVQERGSMALAFGLYLQGLKPADSRVSPLARLEGAIAELRRAQPSGRPGVSGEPRRLVLAPHILLIELPGGTLGLYQVLRARLAHFAGDPVEALLHPKFRLRSTPPLREAESQALLVSRSVQDGIGLEEIPSALAGLLRLAGVPRVWAELLAEARRWGAEPGEDLEVVQDVLRDGLLVEV